MMWTGTRAALRDMGFATAFRCGYVFAYRIGSDGETMKIWRTRVDNGAWMRRQFPGDWINLTHRLPEAGVANLRAATRDCYCGSCGIDLCDFCGSARTPDGAPSSHDPQNWTVGVVACQ